MQEGLDLSLLPVSLRVYLADENLRFPARPKLADGLTIFEMPYGLGFQVRGLSAPVLLRGNEILRIIPLLQVLLDGKRTTHEIIGTLSEDVREAATKTLIALYLKGLIVDVTEALRAEQPPTRDLGEFLDRFVSAAAFHANGAEAANQLANATVILIGEGIAGEAAHSALQMSGLKAVRRLDRHKELDKELEEELHYLNPDLVVSVTRWAPIQYMLRLNELAYRRRFPALFANEAPEGFDIGPLVVPPSDGCIACMVARSRSIDPTAVEEELFQRWIDQSPAFSPPKEHAPFSLTFASFTVAEAFRYLARLAGENLHNHVIRMPIVLGSVTRNRFLSVPRCSVCGPRLCA